MLDPLNIFESCAVTRACDILQMDALMELHDNIMFYLVIILFSVGWILLSIIRNYISSKSPISNKYLNHGTLIELIWTITPALILILIAFPSFKLLYLMDEVTDPSLTVLVEGHQWYWSYQYPDFLDTDEEFIEFDSYLVPESDLEDGALRMLEVDNRVILPEFISNVLDLLSTSHFMTGGPSGPSGEMTGGSSGQITEGPSGEITGSTSNYSQVDYQENIRLVRRHRILSNRLENFLKEYREVNIRHCDLSDRDLEHTEEFSKVADKLWNLDIKRRDTVEKLEIIRQKLLPIRNRLGLENTRYASPHPFWNEIND